MQLSVSNFHCQQNKVEFIQSEICQEEYQNSCKFSKESTNKVMRNEIQF